jgi:pimeloyl-ACP methyl ester carboxylesterase
MRLLSILGFLIFMGTVAQGQRLESAMTCANVVNLEPQEPKTYFEVGERAYLWMRVDGATVGQKIIVEWYWNNSLQHAKELNLSFSNMRTYCYKTIHNPGVWRADIKKSDGTILKSLSIQTAGSTSTEVSPPLTQDISVPAPSQYEVVDGPISTTGAIPMGTQTKKSATPSNELTPRKLQLFEGYETYISGTCTIILPPDYDSNKQYPAVIFLPYTGGTSADIYEKYLYESRDYAYGNDDLEVFFNALFPDVYQRAKNSFITILPGGYGSQKDHSWQGFNACIYRYENRILEDLKTLVPRYNIDSERILLAGHSLGGDLSWAISHRYPQVFSGALVMGSRCSYFESNKMPLLAQEGVKYYLIMGEHESRERMVSFNGSRQMLEQNRIEHFYVSNPGTGHDPGTFEQFRAALNYLLR